ncbi:MAG TPA: oxidoreductase, partial [Rhodobacteraceae bacterium]|nr:oxidoreductase [Paracoccaceae bacterium]
MSPKIALITGASRGFGAAMAEGLAAAGYHVLALARTVGALEELDDRIQATGGSATLVPLDINDQAGLERLCLSIYERWGGLDLWLHSAI